MNQFLSMGLIGFSVVLVCNLAALGLGQADAAFFSEKWWSTWFVNYLVWFVFAVIGVGHQLSRKNGRRGHGTS